MTPSGHRPQIIEGSIWHQLLVVFEVAVGQYYAVPWKLAHRRELELKSKARG